MALDVQEMEMEIQALELFQSHRSYKSSVSHDFVWQIPCVKYHLASRR